MNLYTPSEETIVGYLSLKVTCIWDSYPISNLFTSRSLFLKFTYQQYEANCSRMQEVSEVEKMQTQEHWAECDNESRIKNI